MAAAKSKMAAGKCVSFLHNLTSSAFKGHHSDFGISCHNPTESHTFILPYLIYLQLSMVLISCSLSSYVLFL